MAKSIEGPSNPLVTRYASAEMLHLFSDEFRFTTWRRLWVALAEAERELGLPISAEQLAELKRFAGQPDLARAEELERETRHDVMAHVRAFGEQAKSAAGIIHLGATSCFVTDNTELVQLRAGLEILAARAAAALGELGGFAAEHRALPCLAYTHLQPASPTTVGKRAALWAQDLLLDLRELDRLAGELPFRGAKGASGTQASFLALFDGDARKVERLDRLVAEKMGFANLLTVTGQTYPRKLDFRVLSVLAGLAVSAHKFGTDLRLLMGFGELAEPTASKQVGSSAMPWKRNPMRAERLCSLARHVMALAPAAAQTAAVQWLERTLDDSAGRRLQLPEAFLAADAILLLWENVAGGLEVSREVIRRRLESELPFLATERVLMQATAAGGDRQELHEVIRRHAREVASAMAERGAPNDLLERLAAEPAFAKVRAELKKAADPAGYVGRAPEQVDAFLAQELAPALKQKRKTVGGGGEIRV